MPKSIVETVAVAAIKRRFAAMRPIVEFWHKFFVYFFGIVDIACGVISTESFRDPSFLLTNVSVFLGFLWLTIVTTYEDMGKPINTYYQFFTDLVLFGLGAGNFSLACLALYTLATSKKAPDTTWDFSYTTILAITTISLIGSILMLIWDTIVILDDVWKLMASQAMDLEELSILEPPQDQESPVEQTTIVPCLQVSPIISISIEPIIAQNGKLANPITKDPPKLAISNISSVQIAPISINTLSRGTQIDQRSPMVDVSTQTSTQITWTPFLPQQHPCAAKASTSPALLWGILSRE